MYLIFKCLSVVVILYKADYRYLQVSVSVCVCRGGGGGCLVRQAYLFDSSLVYASLDKTVPPKTLYSELPLLSQTNKHTLTQTKPNPYSPVNDGFNCSALGYT